MSLSLVPDGDRWALYGAGHVCHVTGITYRQLFHWMELGLVLPSVPGEGKGHASQFDSDDIAWIGVVSDLVRLGVQPAHLRDAIRAGRQDYIAAMQLALQKLREVVPLTA